MTPCLRAWCFFDYPLLSAGGGVHKSPLLTQMLSDVLGREICVLQARECCALGREICVLQARECCVLDREICVMQARECCALGAAMNASVSAGIHPDLSAAQKAMAQPVLTTWRPCGPSTWRPCGPSRQERYGRYLELQRQ